MTIEDYIKNLQSMIDDAEDMGLYDEDIESLQFAIKALEQEPILNKIRAEIVDLADSDAYGDYQQGFSFGLMRAVQTIDKYKAESEDI